MRHKKSIKKDHAVVVLPTYNEKANIVKILKAILAEQKNLSKTTLSVLVVDDNSPDGTGILVKDMMKKSKQIFLLKGKKAGLGAAYKRGFKYALETLKADIVMEMDADFSHNPKEIPHLIHNVHIGADFVIGSRYILGGSIPANWPFFRKINSKVGNILAKLIVGISNVNDMTGGFRAIRGSFLKTISLKDLSVSGYVFQVYLLSSCARAGAKITEMPIQFTDRTAGTSKMGLSDITEFVMSLIKLRLRNEIKRIKRLRVIRWKINISTS